MSHASEVPHLVDHLFRRSSGELVAVPVRRLGGAHLDLIEEAIQEAFLRALRTWPYQGVPDNPRGWLYRVASRAALDAVTRETRREAILAGAWTGGSTYPAFVGHELPDLERVEDDELVLLLLSCDPVLSRTSRVVLTLKVGCGFSVREIARAFLTPPAAVAQRLVRAKRLLRERGAHPPEPTPELLRARAHVLREVVYLTFSGGHTAVEGDVLVRAELCAEALRLVRLILRHDGADQPTTRALAALMCLHAARLPARADERGRLVPLDAQDRTLWDRSLLAEGFHHLERAADGHDMTRYHLEAGIAAVHASAPDPAATDWARIVDLYDLLLDGHPSPVVALNRAVAVGRASGPEEGLAAARIAAQSPVLADFHLRPAVTGAFLEELGSPDAAAADFREALSLCGSEPERRYLESRVERLLAGRGSS